MSVERINQNLHELSQSCSLQNAKAVVDDVVSLLGITETGTEQLLKHKSVEREISRFVPAPMFRRQAAAYTIPHESEEPIDIKLFWVTNTTKSNLSWLVALTPNYEDDPESNPNANLGIDFVLSEKCDRLYVVLSYKFKLRVLELHGSLSRTQQEIFTNWSTIRRKLDPTADNYKEQLRSHLWRSFDFEPVNRQFYKELVTMFDHLVTHLKANIPPEDAKMFTVKLFGRTLFLWFLQKKDFLNPKISYFKVKAEEDQTKYYREYLEPLFFEVLNTEIRQREYADDITPFLNGGLFEPIASDFYKDSKLTFPEGFFSQFYEILNRYNFTVDEGTSEYEQVAVDPEMLGRVFENLLASINPETETNARKAQGAFYTPRSVVDYMCEQSLIEYLKSKVHEGTDRDRRIEEIITMDEASFREQDHNKRRDWKKYKDDIVKALDELRILDPAVGSGAFPMGMLQLLVKVYTRLESSLERDTAQLKRDILSRSLYGVDIDQMAIQISRLRAWLSILVDMDDIKRVEPLPNLDFKFVCANTLVPLAEIEQEDLFSVNELRDELIQLRNQYYSATTKKQKQKIRDKYLALILDGGLFAQIESERQKQLRGYNPFNPLNSSDFYDPDLMHGVNKFEIIIGNPPYLESRHPNFSKELKDAIQKAAKNRWGSDADAITRGADLLIYFYETSLKLVRDKGFVCFIVQNSWLDTDYGNKFQDFLLQKTFVKKVIDSDLKHFVGANVNTVITLFEGNVSLETSDMIFQRIKSDKGTGESGGFDVEEIFRTKPTNDLLKKYKWGTLLSSSPDTLELFDLLEKYGKRVSDIEGEIGQGLNLDKSYIVDKETAKSLGVEEDALINLMTTPDGALFELTSTHNYIVNKNRVSPTLLKELTKNKISCFDPKKSKKSPASLLLPRGVSRHFCALNTINAYSASYVEITCDEVYRKNIWLFLNSSFGWLIREISGRKNLGGGLLKAEATDLKLMPVYFEFKKDKEVKEIFELARRRKIMSGIEELDSAEHKAMDLIVSQHLGLNEKQSQDYVNELKTLISRRFDKSKSL